MKKIAIIGAGLSGLMTAHLLKEWLNIPVIIFEEGNDLETRRQKDNNLISGIGGAGTCFGGKFCFPPASQEIWSKTNLSSYNFDEFLRKCIKPFLTYDYPLEWDNIDSSLNVHGLVRRKNYLSFLISKVEMKGFVDGLVKSVCHSGVEIRSRCSVQKIRPNASRYEITYRLQNSSVSDTEFFEYVFVAAGRYAADVITTLLPTGVRILPQNPDMGFRLSVDMATDKVFSDIGKDVKLKTEWQNIGIRTFCVCSGGDKVKIRMKGLTYFDGHFDEQLTTISNMGILARSPKIKGYAGIVRYCRLLERYSSLDLSLKEYIDISNHLMDEAPEYAEIFYALRLFVIILQQNGVLNSHLKDYPLYLPSVDGFNPKVETNAYFETAIKNLYVIGDASGSSRGFVQAMWSAFCASKHLTAKITREPILQMELNNR